MQHEVAGGAHELVTPAGGRAFGQGLSLLLVGQPGGRGQPLDQPVQSEILVVVFHGHLIQRQGFVLEGRLFLVQGLKLALASQQDHLHAPEIGAGASPEWGGQDSNLRPTDYESAALTN